MGLDLEADQEAVPLSQEAAGATDSVPQPSAEGRIKRHRKSSSNASRVGVEDADHTREKPRCRVLALAFRILAMRRGTSCTTCNQKDTCPARTEKQNTKQTDAAKQQKPNKATAKAPMQHNKHKDTDQDPVVPGQKRLWGAHKTQPGTEDVLITVGATCWYDVQLWRGRYSHLSLATWKE